MPPFAEALKANAAFSSGSYRPVALFVGGTSGIGQGIAERLAHHTKGNAHIIICGRNKAAAEKIIQSFPQSAQSQYEFLHCDATLLKNVVTATNELKDKLNRTGEALNYIVLSQGTLQIQGRNETEEGLDVAMSLAFYSRWKFVDELLPLLTKAQEAGQDARVMTVLASGNGGEVNLNDLGLKKTYSSTTAFRQVPTYNDLLVEEYGKRYPKLSFIHTYPGWVNTPLGDGNWWKVPLKPFISMFATSPEKCGEWMLSALGSPAYKQGGFHVDNHGDPVAQSKLRAIVTDEAQEKLARHYEVSVAI